jgi:hypothetical protein
MQRVTGPGQCWASSTRISTACPSLLDGASARTVRDRMAQLEARKEMLEAQLAQGENWSTLSVNRTEVARVVRARPAGSAQVYGARRRDAGRVRAVVGSTRVLGQPFARSPS